MFLLAFDLTNLPHGVHLPLVDGDGVMRTENRFTSQKLDETGLYYYGARYYDPEIGQFVSPDTIVPAPGEVFAYNRYMYAYGNPLKSNDPTGNCSVMANGSQNRENDEECWEAADEVYDLLNAGLMTWGDHEPSVVADAWIQQTAILPGMTHEHIQMNILMSYWGPAYQSMNQHHPIYNPIKYTPHDVPEQNVVPPAMTQGVVNAAQAPCQFWDCVALRYDVSSLGLSFAGDAGLVTGPVAPIVAGGLKLADAGVTATSLAHTADLARQGEASQADVVVSGTTAGMSVFPGAGEVGGVIQLLWDIADPFIPWW